MHPFKRVGILGESILFHNCECLDGFLVIGQALKARVLPRQLEVVPCSFPVTGLLPSQTVQLLLYYHFIMEPAHWF